MSVALHGEEGRGSYSKFAFLGNPSREKRRGGRGLASYIAEEMTCGGFARKNKIGRKMRLNARTRTVKEGRLAGGGGAYLIEVGDGSEGSVTTKTMT